MAQRNKKEWMIQMEWYRLNKKYLTLYIELVIASVLYVIPVILADRYYNDDLSRALYGARGWQKDGRPLGDVLMILLTGGAAGGRYFAPSTVGRHICPVVCPCFVCKRAHGHIFQAVCENTGAAVYHYKPARNVKLVI